MIVLDASAVIALLGADEPHGDAVQLVVLNAAANVHAPQLVDVEVVSALRKMLFRDQVDQERAEAAVDGLQQLAVDRWPHRPLLNRVWSLRDSLTPYDAVYLALAEVLGATLVTLDRGLAAVAARSVEVAGLA